jgi:dsDNA-binding SOS-regulon protein
MIEIEYIVKDRHGVERLRTADKKAADAYDKVLENADRLAQMLRDDNILPQLAEGEIEELTIYLSRNARDVERILKGKAPEPRSQPEQVSEDAAGSVTPIKAAG